jgi:Tol biopolymer transport system component
MRFALALTVLALVAVPLAQAESDLYSIAIDGTDRRNLTGSPGIWEGQPALSPDGTQVAFSRSSGYRAQDVWVMNVEGSGQRPIPRPTLDSEPAWSADGTRIAFTASRFVGEHFGWPVIRQAVEIVDAASGRTVHRVEGKRTPHFSPDGRWLSVEGEPRRPGLWLLDAEGRNAARVASFAPSGHVWSPDSSKIALEAAARATFGWSRASMWSGRDGLYVFHLYGRPLQLVEGLAYDPSWSPAGALAFTWMRVERGLVTSPIWEIAQDVWQVVPGDRPRRLSDRSTTLFSGAPAWSPDGTMLAFAGEERFGSSERLYISRADGSGTRTVGEDRWLNSVASAPVWTPDGHRLLYRCC